MSIFKRFVVFAIILVVGAAHDVSPDGTQATPAGNNVQQYTTETVPASEYPYYQLVNYFVDKTMKNEPKVRDLDIKYLQYFTHIYFGWKLTVPALSLVTTQTSPSGRKSILGASMVLREKDIASMYAPGEISVVIDFVLHCYKSVKPTTLRGIAYVATLRAYNQPENNVELLRNTVEIFKASSFAGDYLLIWENREKMGGQLLAWGCEEALCGDSKVSNNPCGWETLGMPAIEANKQCIYRCINSLQRE